LADGRTINISKIGNLRLRTMVSTANKRSIIQDIVIEDVYYVPDLAATLLSLSGLCRHKNVVEFDHLSNVWTVTKSSSHTPMMQAVEVNGVYEVLTPLSAPTTTAPAAFAALKRAESMHT
jgi:hypothetical protein